MTSEGVYILDTNVISALRPGQDSSVMRHIAQHQTQTLCLCDPVIFEVERGFKHSGAEKRLRYFRDRLLPLFVTVSVQLADWRVAARLWAETRSHGRQLSDVDVLIAAITLRLNGILVTHDSDFAALPLIRTEDWLTA